MVFDAVLVCDRADRLPFERAISRRARIPVGSSLWAEFVRVDDARPRPD